MASIGWTQAHFLREIHGELDVLFPDKWIGGEGPIPWRLRSPDLTSKDFYWWGIVKSEVYRITATIQEDMEQRIRETFRRIIPSHLSSRRKNSLRAFRKCTEQGGKHFVNEMIILGSLISYIKYYMPLLP